MPEIIMIFSIAAIIDRRAAPFKAHVAVLGEIVFITGAVKMQAQQTAGFTDKSPAGQCKKLYVHSLYACERTWFWAVPYTPPFSRL